MIDLEAARALLDMGKRIGGGHRAEEQLRGAVAIHNLLREHKVAYLADEVGMGKTYVALGALALFRHYDPSFRVLVIAPRENIQKKWQKELRNFAAHNVRFDDLRVRSLDGRPARPLVSCGNLLELVRETTLDPNRDFFARMSSFSLAMGTSSDDRKRLLHDLRELLPWLKDEGFDLRSREESKQNFKRSIAHAICCALPKFDLVIIDEAHNLKHGFSTSSSARNQVLGCAFGRSASSDPPNPKLFPHYGPRAERVLFLSATPLEESYQHIWNQLDLFGLADRFADLCNHDIAEAQKKATAARFLVRRVTSIQVSGREHTKNMYRREWRAGGVREHDAPIEIKEPRQQLVVALIQKKVSELLSGKRFNRSFQIGMLASFESFLETAKLKRGDEEDPVFDDAEQTDVDAERDGIDVHDVNRIARSYRNKFQCELPHPKMDAVVESLASAWQRGKKSLIFVRRVASVKELKRKLDERYDAWITESLVERLDPILRGPFQQVVARYRKERDIATTAAAVDVVRTSADVEDRGGSDTFFAWYFRGEGPKGVLSGANIQARFIKGSGAYSTFFADNHVMALLEAEPGSVLVRLAETLGVSTSEASDRVRSRAAKYLSRKAKVITRASRMEAAQAAALELLAEHGTGPLAERAAVISAERYRAAIERDAAREAPVEIATALERSTFFTELRRPERESLRARLWSTVDYGARATTEEFRSSFREEVLRAELLASSARLGHAFIDLYVAAMRGRSTLELRHRGGVEHTGDDGDEREADTGGERLLHEYLDLLETQSHDGASGSWGAFAELSEIAANFELILDVNLPDAREAPLGESATYLARLLRQQQPTAGMAGQVNQTVVRQFRMPGYPFVLVTTDLLQEGEDLHTFCSSVQHYGISWTPSSMEQRIGRIDRVRSQTERRLAAVDGEVDGDDWLQVYFPHLQDTVEVLQVERVLDRMNTFLRLMHEGLAVPAADERRIDLQREMVAVRRGVAAIREPLQSAFPVPESATRGTITELAVGVETGVRIRERFARVEQPVLGGLQVQWAAHPPKGSLIGTATLASGRVQPFVLLLRSDEGRPVVRCVSPIGRAEPEDGADGIAARAAKLVSRVGAIYTDEERLYDLTVEDDVLLGDAELDGARVGLLVRRVVEQADRLEREHFDDERDAGLAAFEDEMRKEGQHE